MPEGNGSFGDIEKAARVYAINELTPVMEALKVVNKWIGEEVIRSPLCVAFLREITARKFSLFEENHELITSQRFGWPHLCCIKYPTTAPLCA